MTRLLRPLVGLVVALALVSAAAAPVAAQDPTTTSSTTATVQVPARDIVPKPDSGTAPAEAGDRGGLLQLGLLGLLVVVIGGAVTGLVRQSRRARDPEAG